jgi:hypothetical protein
MLTLKTNVDDYDSFFEEFIDSLKIITDEGPLQNDEAQRTKAHRFVDIAMESLEKHFLRWYSVKLLPAGVMAEKPLARIISRVILGVSKDYPPRPPQDADHEAIVDYDTETLYQSKVHKSNIRLPTFESFVLQWLNKAKALAVGDDGDVPADDFNDGIKSAAALMATGTVDFRDIKSENPNPLQVAMWKTYLPLASQTQFVERGVKECAIVSATNRGEESRTVLAMIRSARVHAVGIDRDTTMEEKIKALFGAAQLAVDRQEELRETMGDQYKQAIDFAKAELKSNHSKVERKEKLIVDALSKADKNKKTDNVRQRATGLTMTVKTMGLLAYSKLKKDDHGGDLKTELQHRGFDGWSYPATHEKKANKPLTFTDLKNALKGLEKTRVQNECGGDASALANSEKGFKVLSGAEFKMKTD